MSPPTRTAREVVELYNLVVWNERNFELADELFADTVIRHGVGEAVSLTREQNRRRIEDIWAGFDHMRFELPVVVAGEDGEHVAIVWHATMTARDGTESAIANIEVFHVVDGRITEVYNAGYLQGYWK